jgi:acetyltransferase-like isoleucine patch superfamily enzyme
MVPKYAPLGGKRLGAVSSKPRLGSNVIVGQNVRLFPGVSVGNNVFIDDNVTLGYPNEEQFAEFMKDLSSGQAKSIEDYADKLTEIGDNSVVRSGVTICSGTRIGEYLDCDHGVYIGGNNEIGRKAMIEYKAMIYHSNKIGNEATISGFMCNGCRIGDKVAMHGFLVHKYDRPVELLPEPSPIIEDGATIGMLATVIGKVTIGRNAYVGAGAVVTRDVRPGTLVVGIPAIEKMKWLKRVV